MDPTPHAGRVALVTGAARNIGSAIARQLAADGAAVALNYRSQEARAGAEETARAIVEAGGRAAALQADVADEGQVGAMVERIVAELGGLDIVVNNAATSVASAARWTEIAPDEWDRVLRVNATGCFICARAAHPLMQAAGRGDILMISSARVLLGREGNVHYTASKAAQIGLTRTLARELGPEGIRVNALVVGAIQTPDEDVYGPPDEIAEQLYQVQSLRRRGQPEDVATVASFLVSPGARFITGQSITIDGGWVMT